MPQVHMGKPHGATGEQLEPLLAELATLGYEVATPEDLPRLGRRYRSAIPVLVRALPGLSDIPARESVVRALSVPWAAPDAVEPLVREFETGPPGTYRWAVGNALATMADDSAYDQLVQLIDRADYGSDREMLVVALGRMKSRRDDALSYLLGLLEDDELAQHALLALQKLGDPRALPAIEALQGHEDRWLRTQAKKAATRLRAKA